MPHAGNGFDQYGIGVSMAEALMIVCAYSDSENGSFSGATYVYTIVNGFWTEDEKILPDDGTADDKFGRSVDTDCKKVIICGVLNDDKGVDSGSAYIFSKQDNSWQQEIKLLSSDGEANDRFGRSVCIDGEYAAVGSVLDDDNGNSSGSVYIFHKETDGWEMQAKITPDDGHGLNSGSVYLFNRIGAKWDQTEKFNAENAGEGDNYGEAVFIDTAWICIGSPYFPTDSGITGAAFTIPTPKPLGIGS